MIQVCFPRRWGFALASALMAALPHTAFAANDAYSPYGSSGSSTAGRVDDAYRPDEVQTASETYEPVRPSDGSGGGGYDTYNGGGGYNAGGGGYNGGAAATQPPPAYDNGGYGEPYTSPKAEQYEPVPPPSEGGPADGDSGRYYSQSEIVKAGHGFFGAVSKELGEAVEWAFQKAGRPNGYILGEDAGGALIAGLRYGEGTLYTKDAGNHKVYWQGPTLGYDVGAEGSKVMVLVYNLRDPSEIYDRFGGIQGAAYFVGGVGVQLQKSGSVTLAPIRSGIGVRLGANVGYLKYTRNPTWNPF